MTSLPQPGTQAYRVLETLLEARGNWVNGQYFLRTLFLSQYHARIHDLENRFGWSIEHSEDTDEFGFRSYRVVDTNIVEV